MVITDYLRLLWKHSLDSIARARGSTFLGICRLKVIITLPAVWPHYANERMQTVAREAGILDERSAGETTLSFVSEPEAAAHATMTDLRCRPDVKVGIDPAPA